MSDKNSQIPESLKDALERGQVVPFLGADVSLAVKKRNEDGEKSGESVFPNLTRLFKKQFPDKQFSIRS